MIPEEMTDVACLRCGRPMGEVPVGFAADPLCAWCQLDARPAHVHYRWWAAPAEQKHRAVGPSQKRLRDLVASFGLPQRGD